MEVDYAPAAAVNFLEQSTTPQHQAEIISDYVRGAQPSDRQRLAHNAPRGGLTASLQSSQRPYSPLDSAAAGLDHLIQAMHCHQIFLLCRLLVQMELHFCTLPVTAQLVSIETAIRRCAALDCQSLPVFILLYSQARH